jgi:hypothetical protein
MRVYSALTRSIPTCAVVLAAALLAGCEPVTSTPEPATVARVAGEIAYFQDDRTGLCFASVSSQTYASLRVLSIANVPCEDAGFPTTPAETGSVGTEP